MGTHVMAKITSLICLSQSRCSGAQLDLEGLYALRYNITLFSSIRKLLTGMLRPLNKDMLADLFTLIHEWYD